MEMLYHVCCNDIQRTRFNLSLFGLTFYSVSAAIESAAMPRKDPIPVQGEYAADGVGLGSDNYNLTRQFCRRQMHNSVLLNGARQGSMVFTGA